jgi:serine phosphatase RsbU (regulator of sigma subunit)
VDANPIEKLLLAIAKRFRPELEAASGIERVAGVADVTSFLYSAPLALLGFLWLAAVTDLDLIQREWATLSILLVLVFLFDQLRFFIFMDVKGVAISSEGSLSGIVTWSGALLFGPSALWLAAFWSVSDFVRDWRQATATAARWARLRRFALRGADTTLTSLVALALYKGWDGAFPLPGLSLDAVLPALYGTLARSALSLLTYAPFVIYVSTRVVTLTQSPTSLGSFMRTATVGQVLPAVVAPFAILAAGLYTQNGLGAFLFLVAGLLLGSLLARQLSQAVERSQQRSRELEKLEQLGHAIINAPPDASTLPELLQEHVPGMFPSGQIEIRADHSPLFPAQTLVHYPNDWPPVPAPVWEWVRTTPQARCFLPKAVLPWDNQPAKEPLVVAPVLHPETAGPIGAIYIAPRRDAGGVGSLLPAVQSLAAQIASVLHSAQVYTQTLAHQRVEQELALAGEIQASFLPTELPTVAGWQLAATLKPARQTSGDFYDMVPLPNGRLGIMVADVADKGMGAALYMALSRTLIRTYAVEHHARPDFVLRVANNRILMDTQTDLFVTVFYGVLDPLSGTLTYCNAGHNPPYLFRIQEGGAVQQLDRTGLPLGIFRGETWEQKVVQFAPGDTLVLYTDGVTDAQDRQGTFFSKQRLLTAAQAHVGRSAQEIQEALLEEVQAFVGDASQFDDIALMVVVREA